jgi:hypothetical protein
MINLNGYSPSNLPFPQDFLTPVFDTYNDWMQLGDSRIGTLHCGLPVGCPFWGPTNDYGAGRLYIGLVCLDSYYWN